MTAGTLSGNLVLVASGDMSLGLREQPQRDPVLREPSGGRPELRRPAARGRSSRPGDPLAGLEQLAAKVRAVRRITHVQGNVVIDDRLFAAYDLPRRLDLARSGSTRT